MEEDRNRRNAQKRNRKNSHPSKEGETPKRTARQPLNKYRVCAFPVDTLSSLGIKKFSHLGEKQLL